MSTLATRMLGASVSIGLLLCACQPATTEQPGDAPPAATAAATEQVDTTGDEAGVATQEAPGLTNQRLDGNRVVEGYSDLSTITPIDIQLDGVPLWVASMPVESGVVWGVVLEDGRTQAMLVASGAITPVPSEPEQLPAGMPPALRYEDGVAHFVLSEGDASPFTNAVPVGEAVIGVEADGDLRIEDGGTTTLLDADALPDARLLVDDRDRVLFVSNPTERYAHGVLGDSLEGASITLTEIQPEPHIVRVIQVPESRVVEGIAPVWADLDGDGGREIVATLSDAVEGARVVAFREDGTVAAEGPPVGTGGRWRHPIAVAPFGPQGQLELAVVLTPHIGGVVEIYALRDGRLDIVATLSGYTSHVMGSRNLDMAVAAVPEEDVQAVLLAPSQDRNHIGAIRHGEGGAETVWVVDVDGLIVTNVGAASLSDDRIALCVGRSDGMLRIWQPE